MVFKLMTAATKAWRHLWGENQLPKINQGITFRDGTEVFDPPHRMPTDRTVTLIPA
ncbi:hypothetical protein GGE65_004707 [Skermanella aerolata]